MRLTNKYYLRILSLFNTVESPLETRVKLDPPTGETPPKPEPKVETPPQKPEAKGKTTLNSMDASSVTSTPSKTASPGDNSVDSMLGGLIKDGIDDIKKGTKLLSEISSDDIDVEMSGENAHKKRSIEEAKQTSIATKHMFIPVNDPLHGFSRIPAQTRNDIYAQCQDNASRLTALQDYLNGQMARLPVLKQQKIRKMGTSLEKLEALIEALAALGLELEPLFVVGKPSE